MNNKKSFQTAVSIASKDGFVKQRYLQISQIDADFKISFGLSAPICEICGQKGLAHM